MQAHPPIRKAATGAPSAAVLARRVPFDMALPGDDSPIRSLNPAKWHKTRRRVSRGLAVAMVVLLIFGGLLFSQLHRIFQGGSGTAAALQANVRPDLLKGEGRGRVNILMLGRGGGDHTAPDLTDSIMIASIDPVNHATTLLSVPRDLWVNVPEHGVMKINAAWESGEFGYLGKIAPGSKDPKAIAAGFKAIDQTLKEVLDIDIDYNMMLDFQAFKQAVQTVGGVDVNVPKDLVDPTMAWENHNNPVLARAGLRAFDGRQALNYVRSRETSSDFARADRQRAVLVALKSKIVDLGTLSNPFKIAGLFRAFGNNVQTDLSLSNANRLYKISRLINNADTTSLSLAGKGPGLLTTSMVNGQSVVLPKAGLYKYEAIQAFVRHKLRDPYIMKEHAKVLVLNGTNVPGRATAKAKELKSYGYNIIGMGSTPTGGWTDNLLVDLTHDHKYTRNYLERRFRLKAVDSLPDTSISTQGADFVIILGSDATSPTSDKAD
jgi:polyisoprenyl-teichoic acid--peptidoglycan teichoic acid transferase